MEPIGVLHLIDALEAGGAERVAVNLVNLLPRDRYTAYLCTTRKEGPLSSLVAEDVSWLKLHRKRHFDLKALACLVRFIRKNKIRIIHAHSTSLFVAVEVKICLPGLKVMWHDHSGDFTPQLPFAYQLAARLLDGVIAVNEPLALRAINHLKVAGNRVWYIRNFVVQEDEQGYQNFEVTGKIGKRIVCVANFRPQKDHLTLVRAFSEVVQKDPEARLFLIGMKGDEGYYNALLDLISELNLSQQVILLGQRDDVQQILSHFDIGVLSSRSEGLPLALLEYGQARLAAVVTDVGQCREVVDDGRAGLVVPPGDPHQLANAILLVLKNDTFRITLSQELQSRVQKLYSQQGAIDKIIGIYGQLLDYV